MTERWTIEQLTGYLRTWSAVKRYMKVNNDDPIETFLEKLMPLWTERKMTIEWPLTLRVWRVKY